MKYKDIKQKAGVLLDTTKTNLEDKIMTLGEKIKTARKQAGFTQEQMAEKLMVSRPAVTKWETDRGVPDIENLKAIAKILDVSLDYLLNDDESKELNVIREVIDLTAYGKGTKKKIKDKIVKEKYPDAKIMTLLPEKTLSKGEKVIDNVLDFLPMRAELQVF